MKILIFGRGVIATEYAWAFEKAGNQVEFYVRPGRRAQYGPLVDLNILDGRKNKKGDEIIESWPIIMRETIDKNAYDLIIISVNHPQVMEAAKLITPNAGNATILVFNNTWEYLKTVEAYFPKGQVIWGFPGGGGGYHDLHSLKGGLLKTMFLQAESTASSAERHRQVVQLFKGAGFSVMQIKKMQDWLWGHFIMNAAMAAVAMKAGGYRKAFESRNSLKEILQLMRELIPLIKARGGKLDILTALMTKLPIGFAATLLQKSSAPGSIAGEVMSRMEGTGHTSLELSYCYLQDILDDRKKYNIQLPRLMAMEPYFPH